MSQSTRQVSFLTATAIVVANMVGVGVFTSLGFQVAEIPSGFPIILLWLVGGVLAFCGAVCYGELAAMMPRSGGEYHLLSESFHPLMGFLSGWVSVTVGFGAPIAAAGFAFGEYFAEIFPAGDGVSWITPKGSAIALVILVTVIHLFGVRIASRFQVGFTIGKVLLILVLTVAAFVLGTGQGLTFFPKSGDFELIFQPAFALSLFYVMYAYSGWNAAAYIAGEVKNPGRNVPLALVVGTAFVTLLYIGLNTAFLYAAPVAEMAQSGEKVGFVAAQHIFGDQGGRLMGLLISFGLISTISSMIWAGPRVTQVIAEDYRIFGFLASRNQHGAPAYAIILQSIVVVILIWQTSFESLIYYIQALIFLSSLLVVVGLFVLRRKRPDADRPYRTWGYPITPLIYLIASLFMLIVFAMDRTSEMLWGMLTLVVGYLVYRLALKHEHRS